MRRQHGFTLAEMMVALIAGIILIGGVCLIFLMTLRCWQEGSSVAALERTAGTTMEKIVRGVYGRFGLREANIGTVQLSADGQSVTFQVDKHDPPTPSYSDDVTSRYYQLGTRLWYDANVSVAGDTIPLNRFGNVETVKFSQSGDVLTAVLSLSAPGHLTSDPRLFVRMKTEVFFRKRR
jgi:prepilin-type N-terminal cleavage/methylation domain-containing protein